MMRSIFNFLRASAPLRENNFVRAEAQRREEGVRP